MEERSTMTLLNKQTKLLETFNIHTGELVQREGELVSQFVYSIEIADAMCALIREGTTLKNIAAMDQFPNLHIIYNWQNHYPDFKMKMKQAKKDRAEYFHDKAVGVLEDADGISKEEVPGAKLQFDGFLKLAEKGNPDAYNPKPQQLIGGAAPAMIIINTGINRDSPITVETTSEEICVNKRSSDGLRRVYGQTRETEAGASIGAEISGLASEVSDGPAGEDGRASSKEASVEEEGQEEN